MSKKLEGNGFWESSRIIIPEHKEAYLKLMKDRQRRGKPELDDQEVQLIEQALIESYNTRTVVTVTVFSPFDDTVMTGVVTSINTARREVKLFRGEDDFSWIKLEDIISAG
ncbi:YolD-like family protein [Paenibacillus sp. EKM102P]|uniref:YolD-like family protein n=1 Tax=unclassified Paenibacillus TaxID=185978 RepID=UPI00142DB025|nr:MULTISPECIES: YolD-like family protein [unclassified Paenibacillus]KAF6614363.1 YolD-like family protein [Paenibacillus sp. EKM101P]KAF6624578.1 YolD-like family protein [Paenibacillus sp. EKM102P]KAF6635643.1 YolD-like family protein [Paenibacillus sp. EKM10P]KAF6648647.1 YolD-like family protein [Paenibacillus sp. EKM11P]